MVVGGGVGDTAGASTVGTLARLAAWFVGATSPAPAAAGRVVGDGAGPVATLVVSESAPGLSNAIAKRRGPLLRNDGHVEHTAREERRLEEEGHDLAVGRHRSGRAMVAVGWSIFQFPGAGLGAVHEAVVAHAWSGTPRVVVEPCAAVRIKVALAAPGTRARTAP